MVNELIQQLTAGLGIQENQARGGVGLLFKVAQQKLAAGDFSELAKALPGVQCMIQQAPETGGGAKLLGGLASALGGGKAADLATLAGGFSKLGIDAATARRFVPIVTQFLGARLSPAIKETVLRALRQ